LACGGREGRSLRESDAAQFGSDGGVEFTPALPERKSPGEGEATKKELYEDAREAGIEGRSKMSKAELKESLDD
jgi:hypothetical protein